MPEPFDAEIINELAESFWKTIAMSIEEHKVVTWDIPDNLDWQMTIEYIQGFALARLTTDLVPDGFAIATRKISENEYEFCELQPPDPHGKVAYTTPLNWIVRVRYGEIKAH